MCFILIGGNNMKEEKITTFTYADLSKQDLVDEIAWRALMVQPKDVYMEWLDGEVCNVEELIALFDYLNDKLNRRTSKDMADMYKDDFMEKLKIEKLL
tara:strand:+ start:242 stop:535 length:294 start_codon:yes stop_codon:yes gene_type:complete